MSLWKWNDAPNNAIRDQLTLTCGRPNKHFRLKEMMLVKGLLILIILKTESIQLRGVNFPGDEN